MNFFLLICLKMNWQMWIFKTKGTCSPFFVRFLLLVVFRTVTIAKLLIPPKRATASLSGLFSFFFLILTVWLCPSLPSNEYHHIITSSHHHIKKTDIDYCTHSVLFHAGSGIINWRARCLYKSAGQR
jgi:hypothetical protein